ncbi:MAG TPA: hypothetical protein VD931_00050 [Baekduia sp.]|nr:hypothetical protein [Baekduia sp.]
MHTFLFDPLRHRLMTLMGVLAILLVAVLAAAPELSSLDFGGGVTATEAPEQPAPALAPLTDRPQAGPLAPPDPAWLRDPVHSPLQSLGR